MQHDILPFLNNYLWRSAWFINLFYGLAAVLLGLICWKFYTVPDGGFRRALLWLFGACWLDVCGQVLFYNPYFNQWIQALLRLPAFVGLVFFAVYIIRCYGVGGGRDGKI